MKRDHTIDILRGIAIFTMIAANGAGYLLASPHPFAFRLYGTFAAPLFILLSGFMVATNKEYKNYNFTYYFKKGLMVIGAAIFVDVCIWQIYPFTSFDVLYIIGFSMPLAYLILKIDKSWLRWLIIISIFAVTPTLQNIFGYTDVPTSIKFPFNVLLEAKHPTNIFNHFLIDGWFPLFPWLAFSLLGANLYQSRIIYKEYKTIKKLSILAGSTFLILIGILLWKIFPTELIMRKGYSELFYPPTFGYFFISIGVIISIFIIFDLHSHSSLYRPLKLLGNVSLFIYIFHYALLEYVLQKFWKNVNLSEYIPIYLGLTLAMFITSYLLKILKLRWKNRPVLFKFLLGG